MSRWKTALVAAGLALASLGAPASAGSGPRIEWDCTGLRVMRGGEVVRTLDPPGECFHSNAGSGSGHGYVNAKQARVGTLLYFEWAAIVESDGQHGDYWQTWGDVWVSDGTAEGTRRLRGFWASSDGGCGPVPRSRWLLAGSRLFVVNRCGRVTVLEPSGVRKVPRTRSTKEAIVIGDRLFITRYHFSHGVEPWVTDGTRTELLDIRPGEIGSAVRDLNIFRGRLWFTANDGHGRDQWVSDGTRKGTRKS